MLTRKLGLGRRGFGSPSGPPIDRQSPGWIRQIWQPFILLKTCKVAAPGGCCQRVEQYPALEGSVIDPESMGYRAQSMGSRHLRHFIPQELRNGLSTFAPLAPGGQVRLHLRHSRRKSRVRSRCCFRRHNLPQRLMTKLQRRHSGLPNNTENRRPKARRDASPEPSNRRVLPVSGTVTFNPPPGSSPGSKPVSCSSGTGV